MPDRYPRQYLYRRLVRAKLFIDQRYSSAIDLDNIAGEACFSRFHFLRLFRSVYGKTPRQYLTGVRVENAKQLLGRGDTVAKVCFTVGFGSITPFTGLFKRRVGLTPAAFQARQVKKRDEMVGLPIKFVPNCFVEKRGWNE